MRYGVRIVLPLLAAATLTACGGGDSGNASASGGNGDKKLTVPPPSPCTTNTSDTDTITLVDLDDLKVWQFKDTLDSDPPPTVDLHYKCGGTYAVNRLDNSRYAEAGLSPSHERAPSVEECKSIAASYEYPHLRYKDAQAEAGTVGICVITSERKTMWVRILESPEDKETRQITYNLSVQKLD